AVPLRALSQTKWDQSLSRKALDGQAQMSLLPGAVPGVRFGGTRRVSRRDRVRDSGRTPGDRHGAMRRRRREWGRPHTLSWRAAWAGDAEWLSGKSRNRLALVLIEASSWMSALRALGPLACARMSRGRMALALAARSILAISYVILTSSSFAAQRCLSR